MLEGVAGEPKHPADRRQEIEARLDAVRARLKELRQRGQDSARGRDASPGDRLEAAHRNATQAHVAAVQVLASSLQAFRRAADAHERVANVHEQTAAAGIGDVLEHNRQALLHRAAAAADRLRAEHARSLLSESEQAGPASEPGANDPS
jgi:predicted aminopeptidase